MVLMSATACGCVRTSTSSFRDVFIIVILIIILCLQFLMMIINDVMVTMQDQSQPQLQQLQQQYITPQAQLPAQQQSDSNLSAASYHSSGGASDEHAAHSTEQVCHHAAYVWLSQMSLNVLCFYCTEKDLFERVESRKIIDFVRETYFYNQV